MKKVKKSILIATLSIVAGVLLFVIGMSVVGWDFQKFDATEYTAKRYEAQSGERITEISLDVSSFPIVVKAGDAVSLDYYEADNSEVSVSAEGGTLKVVEKYKFDPFRTGLFNFSRHNHKFVLTVPDNSDIVLKGANCDIEATGITLGEFNLNVTNLDMVFTDCAFGAISVNSTNIDMTFVRCSAPALNINSTNADIELDNCNVPAVAVNATNADVDIKNTTAQNIKLTATNGDYSLRSVAVDRLSLDAVNLDADITIVGKRAEYTVDTDGDDLPSKQIGTTDKMIYLEGINCDVKLSFEE